MTYVKISPNDLSPNPFVSAAESALKDWNNPYPDVQYDYDGNEICIDYEYYTLSPDVQVYLESIRKQILDKPIHDVSFEPKTLEIIEAWYRDDNEGLDDDHDDYEHNGLIVFSEENNDNS